MGRKLIIILAIAIIVPNLMIVAFAFLGKPATPMPPPPNPNGYDDFVKAATVAIITNDISKMDRDQLAALVAANSNALQLVHVGLGRECRVPADYSSNYLPLHAPELPKLKELEWVLCAQGRLSELNGQTNEAAKAYLDGVRLGQMCSRGGVLIWRSVGLACEEIALGRIQLLERSLDATNAANVARSLETLEGSEEPIAATFAAEDSWARRTFGLRGRLEMLLERKALQQARNATAARAQKVTKWINVESINFASRAYELEKRKAPASMAELVPEFLKAVPKDPATGKDLGLGQ